jgi:hypothetical protein
MPTFCRHNRFIERCPICSKTLPPGTPSAASSARAKAPRQARAGRGAAQRRPGHGTSLRIHREGRAADDGYRSALVPGLRASADASRLAQEIAFSSARLFALATVPPGLYGEARTLAEEDLERATWMCFLIAYLSPLESEDPFAGIRLALTGATGELPDLHDIPLGPRTSHDPERGTETLSAYHQWVQRGGTAGAGAQSASVQGSQAVAFTGDPAWSPGRRFERVFERLALPGLARMARYDLLVTLGRMGLYELAPDSLHLSGAGGLSADDPTTLAAKRVFGIGDPLLLERRAGALAEAASIPIEALDLALANWLSPQRASMGCPPETHDNAAFEQASVALGI